MVDSNQHYDPKIPVVGFQMDTETRPPYSYVALIAMAIKHSARERQTVSEIYDYISSNFPFYQLHQTGWKNSVRHNLSINDCFIKIPKETSRGRKGHQWTLHPAFEDMYEAGDLRRRRRDRTRPERRHFSPATVSYSTPPYASPDWFNGAQPGYYSVNSFPQNDHHGFVNSPPVSPYLTPPYFSSVHGPAFHQPPVLAPEAWNYYGVMGPNMAAVMGPNMAAAVSPNMASVASVEMRY
ncbi:forkhead box protein L2-like [Stigmatopora nigra]